MKYSAKIAVILTNNVFNSIQFQFKRYQELLVQRSSSEDGVLDRVIALQVEQGVRGELGQLREKHTALAGSIPYVVKYRVITISDELLFWISANGNT